MRATRRTPSGSCISDELRDLSASNAHASAMERLTGDLVSRLDADDTAAWVRDGRLVGLPAGDPPTRKPNYGMSGQRGTHWPPPTGTVPWA